MKNISKKIKANALIVALIYAALGLVLLIWPDLSTNVLCTALGVVLILCGAVDVIIFLAGRDGSLYSGSHLVVGIILAVMGIYIMVQPSLVAIIVPRVIGVLLCIDGLSNVADAITLHRCSYARWAAALILGLLTLGLGALLIYDPFDAFTLVVQLIGAFLLFDGITDFWITTRVSKVQRQIQKDQEREAKAVDTEFQDADGSSSSGQ